MKNVSQERLDEIAEEVFTIGLQCVQEDDWWPLDQLLQRVMQERTSYETLELSMYLRASYSRNQNLPTWDPLLNIAVEQGRMRGDPVNDIFYGFNLPKRDIIIRNTGNLPQ